MKQGATREEINKVNEKKLSAQYTLTTTHTFEGRPIEKYLGVVSSMVVLGTGIFSEFNAGIADILGTRSTAFQTKLESGRQEAMNELQKSAEDRGANAVVGVDIEYMTIGANMFVISANGTAVRIAESQSSVP
jgi:uncharacterized protein YbjQ (UPF0145 family)